MKKLLILIALLALALFAAACSSTPAPAESSSGGGQPPGGMGSVPAAGPVVVESDYDQYASGSQPLPDTGTVITPAAPGGSVDPTAPTSLSQFVGAALFNQNYEQVGVVREFTLDLTSGQVKYVLVESVSGAADSAAWQVLPWSAAQIRPNSSAGGGQQALYVNVPNEALSSAPTLNPDQANGLDASEWEPRVLEFWTSYLNDLPATEPVTATNASPELASGFTLGSTLSNMNVRSTDGTFNLGKVQDVLVDPQTGQLRYLLLVPSVDMGIAQRVIPIPLNVVQKNSEDTLDLPLSIEMLQNAPTVDQNDIRGITAQQWNELVESWWQANQSAQQPQ